MKYSELERRLRAAGCYQVGSSRHPKWYSPITGFVFQMSHHGTEEVAIGTLRDIVKRSGIKL